MTRADRELLLSLHAKVDALLARSEPDIDRYDGALVKLLHDSFDTEQFTRRDVIERGSISPALTRALLDCDVDAKSDTAMHELKYALRRMKGTRGFPKTPTVRRGNNQLIASPNDRDWTRALPRSLARQTSALFNDSSTSKPHDPTLHSTKPEPESCRRQDGAPLSRSSSSVISIRIRPSGRSTSTS